MLLHFYHIVQIITQASVNENSGSPEFPGPAQIQAGLRRLRNNGIIPATILRPPGGQGKWITVKKSDCKRACRLFVDFLKLGCFTFGGGWSIVAQMQRMYVEDRHEMTNEELIDISSVGRSLPGTMIGNIAFMFGYHMAGPLGGFACLLGMVLPPFAVLIGVSLLYGRIRDNPYVMRAMVGVRAAVVPIIIVSLIRLWKAAFSVPPCYLIAAAVLALYLLFDVNIVLLIVLGAVSGLLINRFYRAKQETRK